MALTFQEFAEGEWLKLRKLSKPFAWPDDLSRLKHYAFPKFGAKDLTWFATDDGSRESLSWLLELPAHKARRDGKPIGSRTVHNAFYAVKVVLDAAVELKRLERNPFAPPFRAGKYLPRKVDKRPGWRELAGFELDQVVALTTDRRLTPRRLVWNTLAFMVGGGRTGELANLRWSDFTGVYKGGLGRMVIATAFNTRSKAEKDTKTHVRKLIPVHPYAGRLLEAWHDEGWPEYMARAPTPEDFIVPGADGKQIPNWRLLEEFHQDLDQLGIPRQRQYENRSTFRNLLLRAGATEFTVNLMTHPSPKQASDFYTRPEMQWPAMCDAIRLLDHHAWREAAKPAAVKPLVKPLGLDPELDPKSLALLEAAPALRADIAQSVEQRFRKALRVVPGQAARAPDIATEIATDHYGWFRPDRPRPPTVLEQLIDADLELGAWQLDREYARAESAAG